MDGSDINHVRSRTSKHKSAPLAAREAHANQSIKDFGSAKSLGVIRFISAPVVAIGKVAARLSGTFWSRIQLGVFGFIEWVVDDGFLCSRSGRLMVLVLALIFLDLVFYLSCFRCVSSMF